ncbi:hypothetical protein Vretimale_6395 [Volvox reticuliferus]|uniref:Uncharacterized protein n=1 Tax=Volvox reticuliferus TaxID=1737510 RepID=A0A8J4G7F7_9CHLO|nr:hypothetical protein Vretifemale_16081 [Volvox reticuliferus]GIM01609.1 hypothetical protein Vretimale_6395 [Volvox reticuliferus]
MEAATMAPSRDISQQKLVCPRARKCRPDLSQSEQCQRSKLTSSLQAMATGGEQLGELELILQGQTPDAPITYLGISPPVRSGFYGGAANPIQHDSTWSACAFNASHSNLQALRELDMQHSFLRCTGDYRLLLGSPDMRSFMEEVAERSSQVQSQAQQESSRHLLPFTCRAQYFAVR